jgi:hypothetical protein
MEGEEKRKREEGRRFALDLLESPPFLMSIG